MNGSIPLPPVLSSKLSDFRRRVWLVKLTEGILAAITGLAVSYLLVLGLDRFMETPVWLRLALLILGAAVPGIGLPLQWHKWVWRQRRLEDAAKLLRWKFPRLGDQLLGIVELAKEDSAVTGRSERLVKAAMAQADEAVRDQDFTGAVPRARHRQWAWATAACLALIGGGIFAMPEAAQNALARWLMPWKDTERFTFARVEPLPDPLIVPVAEPFTLPVRLSPGTFWKPESAHGRIEEQPAIEIPQQADGYVLNFPPQKEDGILKLKVGDVRQTLRIEPKPRPELTSLKVQLELPEYLQYKTRPVNDIRGGSISLLRGAKARIEAAASRDLVQAEINGQPAAMTEGRLVGGFREVADEEEFTITWKDSLGLTARVPLVVKVKPVADEAPRLTARRETTEQVVLESEVVAFDLSASDDFGLRQLKLEWKSLPDGNRPDADIIQGSKIVAAGAPEIREMTSRATFCATREGVSPQSIEIRATAEDYLPGREPARSASFILHVLSATDHALWVTQQMGKWLESARETYEREQQLHQTNKELRTLSSAELDRPENRRRVALQASAENANAARLGALNEAGRNLVEQATRNPEFDAPRLESWATMLQSLQDIAANRMPGVADLLKQSADAKTDASSALASASPGANPAKPSDSANSGKPSADSPKPGDSKGAESAPTIALGPTPPAGGAGSDPADPDADPVEKAPSIKLTESNQFPAAPPEEEAAAEGAPNPPSPGKLTLPVNTLAAAPGGSGEEPPPADSPAQQPLEAGVTNQKELLAEFARVTDQLTDILASLEASTFVKRFKAASREQLQLASSLRENTLDAFGIDRETMPFETAEVPDPAIASAGSESAATPKEEDVLPAVDSPEEATDAEKPAPAPQEFAFVTTFAPQAAGKATEQSTVVQVIQSDLEAYFQRRPDQHFKKVIAEMKKTKVVEELGRIGQNAADNLSGTAIHSSEFWADTMDRWAEEMVAAGECENCTPGSSDSLPPEIVLKVMQALRDEMKLRDETRELENARSALKSEEYVQRTDKLSAEQERIEVHTAGAVEDIKALPEGSRKFGKELRLLTAVVGVMSEASMMLATPDTGPAVIAAETEAIELLLQSRRPNPKKGGGGGSEPGGGNNAGFATSAALANLGPGSDANTTVKARPVGQATGRAGREFPEEFKTGLDAYFNNLEGSSTP